LAERFAGAGAAIWFYLSKAFLPLNLVFIYPQWHIHSRELVWILPLASAALVTIVLWLRRNSPTAKWVCPLLFAWGFFCVALLPVLGFADVGFMRYSLVADHYQHVAIIAVVALVAAGIEYWRVTIKSAAQMAPLLAAVLIAALSILTWQQSLLFSGPIRLYSSLLDKNPECSLAHFNLGNVLFRNNQPQDAIQQYELALRYNPNYADAQANLGAALVSLGQPQDAIEHYQQAMRINPDDFDALGNMALAYAALKRPTDAIATAEKSISMARAHDEPALANQIEGWLKSYRAEQAKKPGSASPSQNAPAAP
jgi:tetratricopeptide (TPR) repeat protein